MIYRALIFILCSSCRPDINALNNLAVNKIQIIDKRDFSWDIHEDISFIIKYSPELKLKDIRARVALVGSPQQEELSALESNIALSLNYLDTQGLLSLKPKKSQLSPGIFYGIYMREEPQKLYKLIYVFYIKQTKAKLIGDDVGEKVAKNRRYFSFKFDQPIKILSDQALRLTAELGAAPKISGLRVLSDSKTLIISREEDVEFVEDRRYYFVFEDLVTNDNQKIIIEPLEFLAQKTEENLKMKQPLKLDISSDSAEFRWYLNNNHQAEFYFGEDLSGVYNCLGQSCPKITHGAKIGGIDTPLSFLGSNLIRGLKAKTAYYYILRAEDFQGQILITSGVFKTPDHKNMRFSEFLINPKNKPEHKAEFIELFYSGHEPKKIEDLKLIFMDTKDSLNTCVLVNMNNSLYLRPQDYILIVGQEFDEISAQVPKNAVIIRLPKKSLCGGLANNNPRFIKLADESGMIDYYGAHLWHAPEGRSIVRCDSQGLDELDNYCYSDVVRGPTPGGPN
jgi:hypothetical protein